MTPPTNSILIVEDETPIAEVLARYRTINANGSGIPHRTAC